MESDSTRYIISSTINHNRYVANNNHIKLQQQQHFPFEVEDPIRGLSSVLPGKFFGSVVRRLESTILYCTCDGLTSDNSLYMLLYATPAL
jgi:hypothetical protein